MFSEFNIPRFYTKTSQVVRKTVGRGPVFERFDFRFEYDEFSFVDLLGLALVNYDFDESRSSQRIVEFSMERLGHPAFRFLSADAAYSMTDGEWAWLRGGLDFNIQFDGDFNASRRGHLGTSFGMHALVHQATPTAIRVYGNPGAPAFGRGLDVAGGWDIGMRFQIPLKWFLTGIMLLSTAAVSGYAEAYGTSSPEEIERLRQSAIDLTMLTVERPEDILFFRLDASWQRNPIDAYDIVRLSVPEDRINLLFSVVY
jgi:hypothetical protein